MCNFLKSAIPASTDMKSVRAPVPCIDGFAVASRQKYPCSNVDLMAFLGLRELNAFYGTATDKTNDIWGWTDPDTCTEIAILGMESGTAFIDVTDPSNYVYLGKLPPHGDDSPWRAIKTYKNHAFIVSEYEKHGMQVRCCVVNVIL
jgi:choice-of-anchor B domain-containing protein